MGRSWIDDLIDQLIENQKRTGIDLSNYINPLKEFYANGDYRGIQGILSTPGVFKVSPEMEKWLDNMISQQGTLENREYETYNSENNLLREGTQLEQLGLSSSGVLSTGGVMPNAVASADVSKNNVSLQRYQQRMMIAKQLLGMTSQMASAGIYGNAIGAARKSSAMLASQAAHSARMVTRYDANDNRVGRSISETLDSDFDYSQLF